MSDRVPATPDAPSWKFDQLHAASKVLVSEGNLDTLELMMSDDLTVHILTEIRDAVRGTNERLDQTRTELRAEIGETNQRIDQLRVELRAEIAGLGRELRGEIGEVRDGFRVVVALPRLRRCPIFDERQERALLRDDVRRGDGLTPN